MRYAHTNLIARDYQRLAAFYEQVFGCRQVPPVRDLSGDWLERATGVTGAHIRGVHLLLPGYGESGPTLEVFEYHAEVEAALPPPNRVGYGHVAFMVDDVAAVRDRVLSAGGAPVGSIESVVIAGAGRLTWTYVRDPEGNIIELQRRELVA